MFQSAGKYMYVVLHLGSVSSVTDNMWTVISSSLKVQGPSDLKAELSTDSVGLNI